MLYLHTQHLKQANLSWNTAIGLMAEAIESMGRNHFSQPIKPYLEFENPSNRIIAMPAYLGQPIGACGLKWIASFPENLEKGIQRAHSNTILNDAETGKPLAFFNTAYISGVRTAAVTGMVIRKLMANRDWQDVKVGIAGFGPIGQLHLAMVLDLLGPQLGKVSLFDLRPIDPSLIPQDAPCHIEVADRWEQAYADADIFMTCTVAKSRWIDREPKPGSLQLNVSLRDYHAAIAMGADVTLVDDWDEVCRANTDIEIMQRDFGLSKADTLDLVTLFRENHPLPKPDETVMFHPMGLAIFDVILAQAYYRICQRDGIGLTLPEGDDGDSPKAASPRENPSAMALS